MSRVSVARLAGLSLIWGSSFLFIKVAVEGSARPSSPSRA